MQLHSIERTYDQLGLGILLQDPREDVCNQVDTLLQTPPSNEHKELSLRVLLKPSPFLSLTLQLGPTSLEVLIDLGLLAS